MQGNTCVQCNESIVGPSNRLVQDTCGHKKCRVCLLQDVDKCKQCVVGDIIKNGENIEIIKSILSAANEGAIFKDPDISPEKKSAPLECNGTAHHTLQYTDDNLVFNGIESRTPEAKPSHSAEECNNTINKTANKEFELPKHVVENRDPLSYQCNICNRSFLTKSHVKYHLYCDGEVRKPYSCDICQKEFALKSQFNVHMNKHNPTKVYSCHVCHKHFADKNKLNRHLVCHSTSKMYVCSECGKSFQTRDYLTTHSLIHKGKQFECRLCSARFNNKSNLKRHYTSHSKEKAFMCDQCGKKFKQRLALCVHYKSHLRERLHQCNHCSKCFGSNKDLQRHNLIHADTKGFTCGICNMSFRRKDNLGRHLKNTHPGKKGTVIKNVVKLPDIVPKKTIIDNPNAIHVITAPPAFTKSCAGAPHPAKSTDSRPGTVISGPIKLAFKTPAFKSHYNIDRNLNDVPPAQIQKTYDHSESLNICQKIFNPPPLTIPFMNSEDKVNDCINREVCQKILAGSNTSAEEDRHLEDIDPLNKEVCQKILMPYSTSDIINKEVCHKILSPNSTPLHYETSFQNRKHAMIKNIKFKVPLEYTQNNLKPNEKIDPFPTKDNSSKGANNVCEPTMTATSVIVNNNVNQVNGVHWRRRMAQNLSLHE